MLVNGSRESLISRTTSVLVSNAGSIRVNFIMWPGNHEGGVGSAGIGMWVNIMAAMTIVWVQGNASVILRFGKPENCCARRFAVSFKCRFSCPPRHSKEVSLDDLQAKCSGICIGDEAEV